MPDRINVIRVGEKNNFNFTGAELKALEGYAGKGIIFVNSNSFVRITAEFPSIITINPYMHFVEPRGDLSNIKACRIKWVVTPNAETKDQQEKALVWCLEHGIKALITFFRFMSYDSMSKYTSAEASEAYLFDHGWLRPRGSARLLSSHVICTIADSIGEGLSEKLVYYCDWEGRGCPSCGNCIRLVTDDDNVDKYTIKSLNLSVSGDNGRCIFQCPDCWAHRILAATKEKRPKCDIVFSNLKQKGKVSHA